MQPGQSIMKTLKHIITRPIALTVVAGIALSTSVLTTALAGPATRVAGALWAHDSLYDTVLTDTAFVSPPVQSTDALYFFGMSGLEGQRSVSEAAPGDRGYNGGRWRIMVVRFTETGARVHDADGDGGVDFELTNAEDVLHQQTLGHLVIEPTAISFECPMLPRRNR